MWDHYRLNEIVTLSSSQGPAQKNPYCYTINPLFIISKVTVKRIKIIGTNVMLIFNINNSRKEENSRMALSFPIFRILVFIILILYYPIRN